MPEPVWLGSTEAQDADADALAAPKLIAHPIKSLAKVGGLPEIVKAPKKREWMGPTNTHAKGGGSIADA
jgi:hypothetical protein